MLLSYCCHVGACWSYSCHFVIIVLSFWCILCLSCCCHCLCHFGASWLFCCHLVGILLSFGALDDCHFVGMLLRILVHVGHVGVIVLSFCHCGALDDCHVVVILLSFWSTFVILL